MIKFEYTSLDLNSLRNRQTDVDVLNAAGARGWELVSISPINIALLKRPIRESEREEYTPRPVQVVRKSEARESNAPEAETREEARKDPADLKKELSEMALSSGFTLDEVMSDAPRPEKAPVPIKYRDPNNPANTWTGRGRMPRWLSEAIAATGATKEDFAV